MTNRARQYFLRKKSAEQQICALIQSIYTPYDFRSDDFKELKEAMRNTTFIAVAPDLRNGRPIELIAGSSSQGIEPTYQGAMNFVKRFEENIKTLGQSMSANQRSKVALYL